MPYKPIPLPDASILGRISEHEVEQWLVARLHQMRGVQPAVYQINLAAYALPARLPYVSWSGHAEPGACAVDSSTTADVFIRLQEQLNEEPLKKANDARVEAERLLRLAEELEAKINH